MVLGQVTGGTGLGALSIGMYLFTRWQAGDDDRMRRLAQSRWWLDRRTVRKVRRGEMSQGEWFNKFAGNYRATIKWVFTPVLALLLLLSIVLIAHGVTSSQ
jgi:hypothetical protein